MAKNKNVVNFIERAKKANLTNFKKNIIIDFKLMEVKSS